jgi:hypothetical protein
MSLLNVPGSRAIIAEFFAKGNVLKCRGRVWPPLPTRALQRLLVAEIEHIIYNGQINVDGDRGKVDQPYSIAWPILAPKRLKERHQLVLTGMCPQEFIEIDAPLFSRYGGFYLVTIQCRVTGARLHRFFFAWQRCL